jgi:hypothetical protein
MNPRNPRPNANRRERSRSPNSDFEESDNDQQGPGLINPVELVDAPVNNNRNPLIFNNRNPPIINNRPMTVRDARDYLKSMAVRDIENPTDFVAPRPVFTAAEVRVRGISSSHGDLETARLMCIACLNLIHERMAEGMAR